MFHEHTGLYVHTFLPTHAHTHTQCIYMYIYTCTDCLVVADPCILKDR